MIRALMNDLAGWLKWAALGLLALLPFVMRHRERKARNEGRDEGRDDTIEQWEKADEAEADALRDRVDDAGRVRRDDADLRFRD